MNSLIPAAWAAEPAAGGDATGGLMSFLPLIVIFVIFYFLLIRPQTKRAKEHQAMIAALGKGDEVVTAGGLVGRIVQINDQYLTIEIAEDVEARFERSAVQKVLPKGTIKSV